jgi:hypothetical protein
MAKGKQGLAIFSDWRRYASEVALPSGASYCCRIGVNVVFMAAFDIPVTAYTVALVASSHMLSGLFAITPRGVGQTQALDVATLGRHAPTENVAAFSVTQDSVLMMWNVVLGVALMLWAFGYHRPGSCSRGHAGSRRRRKAPLERVAAKTGIASLCEPRTTMERVNFVAGFKPKPWHEPGA